MTKARDLANVISGSGTLNANVIPALPASKITSGTFDDARLSSSSVTQHVDLTALSASNLTSGTVPSARLSLSASDVPDLAASKITSGTFADARISSSSVTAHVDLTALDASNLTSGTIPNARYGTPTFSAANLTSVPAAAVTQGTWTPSFNSGSYGSVEGKYQKAGQIVWVQAEGRMTTASASDNTVITMGGLPFTSLNIDSGGYTDWPVANGDFHVNGTPRKITLGRNTQTAYISAGSIKHQQHTRWLYTGIYDTAGNNLGSYGAAHALRSDDFNDIRDNQDKNWWFVSFIYISNS